MGRGHTLMASSRYFLGVLPRYAIATSADGPPLKLKALSLGPDALGSDEYLAIALDCPSCDTRIPQRYTIPVSDGTIWFTYRGDSQTCNPQRVPGSTEWRCHTDRSALSSKVFVHFAHRWGNFVAPYTE